MDLFHSLVDAPTSRIIAILMGGYMTIVVMFAIVYYIISLTMDCNLDITNIIHAFAFSLETMATIGYSTKDIFFNDCIFTLMVLSAQICVKLIADAVTIGVLYCKLSRPSSRASTVIFSHKGVIRRIRGKLYFMFQLCELRKHQLVEAHVRVYAVRKEIDLASCFTEDTDEEEAAAVAAVQQTSHQQAQQAPLRKLHSANSSAYGFAFQNSSMSSDEGSMEGIAATHTHRAGDHSTQSVHPEHYKPVNGMQYHILPSMGAFHPHDPQHPLHSSRAHRPSYMQTCAMRLNHPNDELGGMLLLMTPQVVVHEIDAG